MDDNCEYVYEACGTCGWDHGYEPVEAMLEHRRLLDDRLMSSLNDEEMQSALYLIKTNRAIVKEGTFHAAE